MDANRLVTRVPMHKALFPHHCARALVNFYGVQGAADTARDLKSKHPDYSEEALFYDEVGREIERGLFATPKGEACATISAGPQA